MELIYQVLLAIVNLHINSEPVGSLPPAILYHFGKFTECFFSCTDPQNILLMHVTRTIHKIHAFIEGQQEGSKIRNFFRQSGMNSLLKDCQTGIQHALEAFKVKFGIIL